MVRTVPTVWYCLIVCLFPFMATIIPEGVMSLKNYVFTNYASNWSSS